jgi:GT2 family glycosyltransferase
MRASVVMATMAAPGWDAFVGRLLAQTHDDVEVVVVVDRATSADEQAQLRAGHPAVRFIFNEANLGLTASLNRGLAAATGEVVIRTDDDDESTPDRIAKQVAVFESSQADFVCAFADGVTSDDPTRPWRISHPQTDSELKAALLGRNVIVHPALAFRRDSILALGGYDETFRYAQDYALYLKAIRAGLTFAVVPEALVTRSYSPDSITVKRRTQQMMYSTIARLLHAAERGDVGDFLATMVRRGALLAAPNRLRHLRRKLFKLLGRGA